MCPSRWTAEAHTVVERENYGESQGGGWRWAKADYAANSMIIEGLPAQGPGGASGLPNSLTDFQTQSSLAKRPSIRQYTRQTLGTGTSRFSWASPGAQRVAVWASCAMLWETITGPIGVGLIRAERSSCWPTAACEAFLIRSPGGRLPHYSHPMLHPMLATFRPLALEAGNQNKRLAETFWATGNFR